MKIRQDFVSNSSSCSFLIHLQSKKDHDEFKSIFQTLTSSYHANVFGGVDYTCNDGLIKSVDEIDDMTSWVQVNCGDDSLENVLNFEDVERFIEGLAFKFKVYRDDLAHSTFGQRIPKDIEY